MSDILPPELDPQVEPVVRKFDLVMGEPGLSIEEMRLRYSALLAEQGVAERKVSTRDIEVPTRHGAIRARLYLPPAQAAPLLVYMHGGGFMVGDIECLEKPLHELSGSADIAILSLDYALAPEHVYPIALEQCLDALEWAAERRAEWSLSTEALGIGGDSAGGNLAALVALRTRDSGGPRINWQALINPVLDFPAADEQTTASHRAYANGPILKQEVMKAFGDAYFADEAVKREASPVLAPDLSGLPSAFVAVAQCDPLRDDGVRYAERLNGAGVPATLKIYPGMSHNFIVMTHVSETARAFMQDFITAARTGLGSAAAR